MQGYTYFSFFFVPKHRLWPRRGGSNGEAVLTCTHNECFEQTYKNHHLFSNEIVNFNAEKILSILHGQVFVMSHVYRFRTIVVGFRHRL